MLDELKADFDGILELVNKCPANLQEMAFKTILEHWFTSNTVPPAVPTDKVRSGGANVTPTGVPEAVKPFLTANAITMEMLEKAFHPTGPGAQLLVSDIPGSGNASKQVNLALLLAVRQALGSGSFSCTLKELREMAIHYNCYDAANLSTTLKSYKTYFKPRAKGADLELSGPGQKKAADLIKGAASV